jgi:hypothetical protein
MHNWFAIETEAEFRRQEWARAVAADTRTTRALATSERPRRFHLPRLTFRGRTSANAPRSAVTGLQLPRRGIATT